MVHMTESARERPKTYKAAVDFVRQEILEGHLHPGDKLPTERELAAQLDISRNSVREGLRVLENLGVLSSTQGSGNYIALNFDETISEALSFLYHLRGMQEGDVTEFRWMIEREALSLCQPDFSRAEADTDGRPAASGSGHNGRGTHPLGQGAAPHHGPGQPQ